MVPGNDMKMQVKHGLAACSLVELLDEHAVGGEGGLDRSSDLLRGQEQRAEYGRRGIQQVPARRFRQHEGMAIGLGHDIHDCHRVGVFKDLMRGISPQRMRAKMLFGS